MAIGQLVNPFRSYVVYCYSTSLIRDSLYYVVVGKQCTMFNCLVLLVQPGATIGTLRSRSDRRHQSVTCKSLKHLQINDEDQSGNQPHTHRSPFFVLDIYLSCLNCRDAVSKKLIMLAS